MSPQECRDRAIEAYRLALANQHGAKRDAFFELARLFNGLSQSRSRRTREAAAAAAWFDHVKDGSELPRWVTMVIPLRHSARP